MKFKLVAFVAIFTTHLSFAADINCGGKVSWLMADHPACQGNVAFKTEATGGKNGKWMCTKSKEGSSVALAALTANKNGEVYIEGGKAASCSGLPHYREISYIIINP
ncbi:hypothetical protein [Vibrio tubiashii]|uniref:hypothetical protein n=1 Tax=Vibrio tubiashii TaxID=29498 RepID=UPI00349E57BF